LDSQSLALTAQGVVSTDHVYMYLLDVGTVTLSVLSKGVSDSGMLVKTVSKPIKPLSACPLSPCQTSTPAPSSPAPATTNNNGALNFTGNPMVSRHLFSCKPITP
jgi:hypothetical protein